MNLRILFFSALILASSAVFAAKPKAKAKAVDFQQLSDDAEEALMLYDIDALDDVLSTWADALSSRKDTSSAPKLKELQNRAIAMRNMLSRVERIVVLDSLSVDSASFYSRYRLSPDAGSVSGSGMLTTFRPASGREVFFTEADSAGVLRIMHAGILDDGTQEAATPVDLRMPPGTSTAFPFLLSDGSTLYFSANPDNDGSLGAFDIYMTRRNDDGLFYEPVNVGMPYNSPGNDLMMAIDDATGLGWWATDRNAEDGQVTVYIFVPNESRINYDADDPRIRDLAFITSVADTRPEGYDTASRLAVLDNVALSSSSADAPAFVLSLGDGRVYTSFGDFANPLAAQAMREYLSALADFRDTEQSLAQMRRRYAAGDTSVSSRILDLEAALPAARRALVDRRNVVIRLESSR